MAVVLLLIIGISAQVHAQNSAVYYYAGGSLSTSGVGPATNGTSVPAACVIPLGYSLQTASSAAALEAADLYSLEATVIAKTSNCVAAINSAVQAFASSCQGQVTVKTQPFGPWQDDSSEEAIEFNYANSYSTTAFCTESWPRFLRHRDKWQLRSLQATISLERKESHDETITTQPLSVLQS